MSKEEAKKEEAAKIEAFAQELERDSDDEEAQKQPKVAEDAFETNGTPLSDAEREIIKEELKKTEDEIVTLRQVLHARQKHASELKRKLGLTPLAELSMDINKTLKTVGESEAFQKTSEVASATAEQVKGKWNDMRNSTLFKSFESKLGTAYNSAKMTASTSIDKLSGAARSGPASNVHTPSDDGPYQQS